MAHQLQKQRDFQQILWFPCDLERERERDRIRSHHCSGFEIHQDNAGLVWRDCMGLLWNLAQPRGISWLCKPKMWQCFHQLHQLHRLHRLHRLYHLHQLHHAQSTHLCQCVRECECVADCFSHVTHVSHVQHIVRSLAFLPWRWPGTSLSHGTSTGPESVGDAIHKLQRCLACDSFTRWNAEGDYSDLFCVEKSRQKIHAVMQSHNFNRSNRAVLHAQSWRVRARGRFREKSPPTYGLVESNLPFGSCWWNSQMIYESCMNDSVLLSSGFCDSSSKCSTCRRTIESFKIPNNIHTYDLIGMCFCLSIPYCLSCSNSATVFQLKRLSTCDCSNGWLWFQTWAMWRRCLKPVLGATRFDHFDNSPVALCLACLGCLGFAGY